VFDYRAVEVYLHAFSATALDRYVPLTSTSDVKFSADRITDIY